MIDSREWRNIRLIRDCLERSFSDVTPSALTEHFIYHIYHDGSQTSELVLDREFFNNLPLEHLQEYMEGIVIPTLLASPGKNIRIGADGINILAREMNRLTVAYTGGYPRS